VRYVAVGGPNQIHRILHADLEVLCTVRGMHMCGVAGQQDPSVAVDRGLPSHIGESGIHVGLWIP